MLKDQINILSQLAHADNELAEKERTMIQQIGMANGMSKEEVNEVIDNPEPIGDLQAMSDEEKYEYLYNIVQLMKIDGKVYKSEIVFCQEMAEKLGYRKNVISELSSYIYSDPSITSDRELLKKKISKFIQSRN